MRYEQILLRGIRAAARQNDCNLLLACGISPDIEPAEGLPAWPIKLPQTNFVPVGPWNTSGLIVVPPFSAIQEHVLREIVPAGHPLVFTVAQAGYPSVAPANEEGIAHACAHLIAHGHQRIAFIAADARAGSDGAERMSAYRAAITAHGLPLDAALIGYGGHNVHESSQALRHMLAAGVEFTAVLTSNDESAIGVLQALREAGQRVPDDVAVIGFDDVLYARAQSPPLTTIRHPTFELGYRAVELLLDYMSGRRSEVACVRVPTRLIVRDSCGCQSPGSVVDGALHAAQHGSTIAAGIQTIIHTMVEAVAAETRYSSHQQLQDWCERLVLAFHDSLMVGAPTLFAASLDTILGQVERTNDDIYAWQAAISVLRDQLGWLLTPELAITSRQTAEQIIDHARVSISERLRRQHTRYLVHESERLDRIGAMTMRLLTALEPQQILAILADHLPSIGIRHAHIARFEAEGADSVAWSNLYVHVESERNSLRRFRSRNFPPSGLFDSGEPFQLALLPLVVEDGPAGFVAFDATYLEPCGLIVRHVAAALRNSQLHAAAEEGRRLAEAANRLKSRFLSTVSHELRQPLSLIVGLSELLLHERTSGATFADSTTQDLQRINANAQHLGRLIGDVLDLASSEAGQLRLLLEPLNLAEILQPIVAIGAQMTQEKGLAWHVNLAAAQPWVRGDRTRLRQVVLNLLSNAVKFTAHGAISMELSVDTFHATLTIQDTGPGVPRADQRRIFDEFSSSTRTSDRGYGGLGLGLAICKQLIERQGGTIGVYSSGEEQSGATFFFSLPLLAPDSAEDADDVDDPRVVAERPRVVFLSAQGQISDSLSVSLGQRGFDVQTQRIDPSIKWLSRLVELHPNMLILDEALATQHGWETLSELKRHPATTSLPILMYALDSGGDRGSLLEMDYLMQPLDPEQLSHALVWQRGWDTQPAGTKTILVVDDDPDTLALHTRLVRQQLPESQVIQARNGREALAVMQQTRPNLVLLDLTMPELDGFGVLEAMRARADLRDVPVVVLTAQILTDDNIARLNAGVAAILSKGLFSSDEILEHLQAALTHQRKLGSTMQQVVRRTVAYIHTHYAEVLTREHLAAQVGVSGDHLTASFRQEMGITPITYLNRYRISRARLMLEESNRSITDVALSVGFSDLGHFSRTFHREVGVSPNTYRRTHQR